MAITNQVSVTSHMFNNKKIQVHEKQINADF